MKIKQNILKFFRKMREDDGSAMIIALLIMMLLMGFVALAITRTNSETLASANDATESRTFDASYACLENMTRNFNKIFEVKLNVDTSDITRIQGQVPPGFPDFSFVLPNGRQTVEQTGLSRAVVEKAGQFQGLNAIQDEWTLNCTTTNTQTGVQVALQRRFLNNRIPIFQFGIFYDDDMEFHPGPQFNFGGRVHANGNIFLAAQTRLDFASKVTAQKNIFTDVSKSGRPYTDWGDEVYVRDQGGTPRRVNYYKGSALTTPVNGAPLPQSNPANPVPTAYANASWPTYSGNFGGNLLANVRPLKLPLKLNADINGQPLDLREIVKRGKSYNSSNDSGDVWNDGSGTVANPSIVPVSNASGPDDGITAQERYYNKTGIRVSLADSKAKLPGCVKTSGGAALTPVTSPCGVQLDGNPNGVNPYTGGPRGYDPSLTPMTGGAYTATEVNGERFYTPGKETWIKIETVQYNATTLRYDTVDITKDILALGMTEQLKAVGNNFFITDAAYPKNGDSAATLRNKADGRSIIKLQRYLMSGPYASSTNSSVLLNNTSGSFVTTNPNGANGWPAGMTYNFVLPGTISGAGNTCTNGGTPAPINGGVFPNGFVSNRLHWKAATVNGFGGAGTVKCVEAFPINMFDTREGLYNDTSSVFNPLAAGNYGTNVPWAGVMSMVDIDIANLKRFLDGDFDGGANPGLPAAGTPFSIANNRALRSTDIPSSNGWVLYISDRRGDRDFDGQYDMEDIYGNNDAILQLGEDVNSNNSLQADFSADLNGAREAVKYVSDGRFDLAFPNNASSFVSPDIAAVFDHKYYRRGVRLINGSDLPGFYDTATPSNSKGFTVASENAVYVFGNYNATGIASVGTPTPYSDYLPQGTRDVPASIAADAVMILSNNWSDARSFRSPFTLTNRDATETFARFAMLAGDAITTLDATPNQGGGDTRMNGGVHNFKRFLEDWSGVRLNYTGSLINLFYAQNNNGAFKCCNNVYSPPTRNWVFDASFLDINRIPPGTPFFQDLQITGFQRINN